MSGHIKILVIDMMCYIGFVILLTKVTDDVFIGTVMLVLFVIFGITNHREGLNEGVRIGRFSVLQSLADKFGIDVDEAKAKAQDD